MRRKSEEKRPLAGRAAWWLVWGTLIAALALTVPMGFAQTSGEEPQEDPEKVAEESEKTPPVFKEKEVRVTARKRVEDPQEVPVAISVVTGDVLEESGAEDISAIQESVPNLSIYSGRNQSTTLTVFLRGVGQADPLWGVDPGVGLYLDDVYIARPQGALLDVFDVERIEVLRGPQGTLYGKNTIGGAIKYVSRELTDETEARVSLTGGDFGTQDFKGSLSGAIIEGKLRAKVAYAKLQRNGYGTNRFLGSDNSDKDTTAYRIAVDFLPTDKLRFKLAWDQTRDDANPKGYARLEANPFCPLFLLEECNPLSNNFDTEAGLEPVNGTKAEGISLTAEWDINDEWSFKSITAYRETDSENNIDFDTTPAAIADAVAIYFDDQRSQEFQVVYDNQDNLSGVFGLYYFDGRAGGKVNTIFFGGLQNSETDGDIETESYAAYADGSYSLTDRLTLNAGVRFTDEEKRGRAFNRLFLDPDFTLVALVAADFRDTATFSSFSPRIGLDYKFNDDVLGYVTLSRGFKSGGFNVRAQSEIFPESAKPFDDEQLTVGEVGVKSVLADGQVTLNAAVFYGDYTDVQVSTFTSYDSDFDGTDDSFFGNFLNAGDAELKGVEVEFDIAPESLPWFRAKGNLSYLDSDEEIIDNNDDGFVDTRVITNAPELTGSLALDFNWPTSVGVFTATTTYAYRDDSTLTNEGGEDLNNPGNPLMPIIQKSYDTLSARLGWVSRDGHWGVTVNGRNLTDEDFLTNGYNIPVIGVLTGSYGAPRTVTATLEYRFF